MSRPSLWIAEILMAAFYARVSVGFWYGTIAGGW